VCVYIYEQWFGITAPVPSSVDAKVLFALLIEQKDIKTINYLELYQIVAALCKFNHPIANTVKLEDTSIATFRADCVQVKCFVYIFISVLYTMMLCNM
jgi:hypothetical protein